MQGSLVLADMNILITAGPTREPIDPVRFLSNRSSGKMGYALAQAAKTAGHVVTLVCGPTPIVPPADMRVIKVETAREMFDAVRAHVGENDAAIFAAAVADYTPAKVWDQKIKKSGETLTLELVRTPDILGSARGEFGFKGVLAGFAAETEDVQANAEGKLLRKGCDLIVANDVSRPGTGFDADHNEVLLITKHDPPRLIAKATKHEIAREIIRVVERMHDGRPR